MLNRYLPAWAVAVAVASVAAADPPHADARRLAGRFQDWRLACAGACAIETRVAGADGSEILRITATADVLAVTTPLPLLLPDGLALALGDRPGWQVAWRSCVSDVCEARLTLEGELLAALKRERGGAVSVTLIDGVRVRLPVSLLGFTAAWSARAAGACSRAPAPSTDGRAAPSSCP